MTPDLRLPWLPTNLRRPFGAQIISPFRYPGLMPGATLCHLLRRFVASYSWTGQCVAVRLRARFETLMGSRIQHRFAICVRNEGYLASLGLWKVYRVLPDRRAAKDHLVRILHESGEDYLYDQSWFVPIKLPQAAKTAMLSAST